jgi:hypothetical protein
MGSYLDKENGDGFYLVSVNAMVYWKKQPKLQDSLTVAKIYRANAALQDPPPRLIINLFFGQRI